MNTYKEICDEVVKIISPLYLVGGAVRNIMLGKEPVDLDFTTPLSPDEIEAAIRSAKRHPYLIGKRYGTIGVKINGMIVEITTFRTEKYEEANRKPQVEFVKDINEDLSRRDFTINSMCLRCDDNYRLINAFNGKEDLQNKIIRCVGNPKERFKEDFLRALRAGRFASQLEFTIDPTVTEAVLKKAHHILDISKERWVMEMDKLLMTDHPEIGLEFLAKTRLLNFMFPELALQVGYDQNSPFHSLTLWEHTKKTITLTPKEINWRWAAFLHDSGKIFVKGFKDNPPRSNFIKHDLVGAEVVEKYASYLKWSNERREKVKELVLNHLLTSSPIYEADKKAH